MIQRLNQNVALEVPDPVLIAVVVGAVGIVCGQPQGREKVYGLRASSLGILRKCIQRHRLLVPIRRSTLVDAEIRQFAIAELHALDGILTESRVYLLVRKTGRNVRFRIPNAVVLSPGQVVFVQGQGSAAAGVDGCSCGVSGRNAAGDGKSHDCSHGKGAESFQNVRFHR